MKAKLLILFILFAIGATAQVRPDNFTELTTVDTTNAELYSQKNGVPRKMSLFTLKKYMDQELTRTGDSLFLSRAETNSSVYIGDLKDTLRFSGDTIYTSNGFSVYIGSLGTQQTLSFDSGTDSLTISGSGGNSVYLGSLAGGGTDPTGWFESDSLNYLGKEDSVVVTKGTGVITITITSPTAIEHAVLNVDVTADVDGAGDLEIQIVDNSGQVNNNFTNLWIPSIQIYDAGPVVLGSAEIYDVSHGSAQGTIPHDITWGTATASINLDGAGDFGGKTKIVVVMSW